MKHVAIVTLLVFTLVGCAAPQSSPINIEATVGAGLQQTLTALPTVQPPTIISTKTLSPTLIPSPTNTPRPLNTVVPSLTPTQALTQGIAKNFIVSDEDSGILIEVVRIFVAPKESVPEEVRSYEIFNDKSTFIQFIFRITNSNNKIVQDNFHMTIAAINGEQVLFNDFYWGEFGDNLSDSILPGSTVIGGYWTGIKRSSWDEVNKIIISIPHVFDSDYNRVTKDFLFTIDVNNWSFEPLPDELK